ncbi:MAG: ferritin family protein [Desulfobulbales bacterium]|nr:ferritin family protein [Desulfobulbales bacterium]
MRSRSAATLLLGAGLKNVYSMDGGIRAWQGMVAHGQPEAGMAYFTPAANFEEIVGLAWALEEGSKLFYQGVSENFSNDKEIHTMFGWLVSAEKNHEKHLLETYESLTGEKPDFTKLRSKFTSMDESVMEGGIPVKEALAWVKDKDVSESLELAIAMEVNALDLYIKMSRSIEDEKAQHIFKKLSEEEQTHLEKLAALLDKKL